MMTRAAFFLLLLTTPLLGQQGDRSDTDFSAPPPEWEIPPAPVLTAEEALETFTLQPGFRIELVASEPLLHDPVAIDFDEDGRIWVVEMQSYMPNVDGEGEIAPVSRVVVLEDTTGDGRMDKSTVYLENLVLPRAIRVVAGGVLVGEPPNLWFTRDTDGDGRADEKISIYDRYSHREANPEHGPNGLLIGIDNWIHNAMFEGGRFRFVDGEWIRQPALMRGQWGISQDDYGRVFTNSNSDYLRADLVPNHYYSRNPNFPARGGVIPGSMGGVYEQMDRDQRVWPARITPGVNRRVQLRDDGRLARFTAACAPLIYRGDQFPEEFRGNAFVAEPAAHFIRRSILREDENGVIRGSNAYEEDEFLHSSDERFRPVNLYTAPDGTLYIVDMYRGILQHRQFVTTYLRNQIIERELEQPLGLGRIYRVVHESREPGAAPTLSRAASAELVQHLSHENGWWRDTAQRLLIERGQQETVPLLQTMAKEHPDEVARIHALWTLEGLRAVDQGLLLTAFEDASPRVRAAGVRVAETILANAGPVADALFRLLADSAPIVRLQATLSLGGVSEAARKEAAFARVLQEHAAQPFLIEAVLCGLPGRELEFIESLVAAPSWQEGAGGRQNVFTAFAGAVMREGEPQRINRLLELVLTGDAPEWQRLGLLRGIEASRVTKLTERPVALDHLASEPTVHPRPMEVLAKLEWPQEETEEEELPAAMQELVQRGESRYQMTCSACHQAGGQGMEGLASGLVGSPWVLGDEHNLIRIVLHGKEGESLMMPPMGSLDDETLASILSYIRRSWGNSASVILPETVARVREGSDRAEPWTENELRALARD
jgi:mono/diheme cytochrome c family protein/glucose/arabinose dehydrogenase